MWGIDGGGPGGGCHHAAAVRRDRERAAQRVLAVGCLRRGLRPEPFLLALACAANVGSAATLIGNPQNMLC